MILISIDKQKIIKLTPKEVAQEEFLQSYINQNPEVIPLDELKGEVRLLILGREFPTPSGPIDVLAMDQDGDLYIIETKLFKNPDKRKVIAQVLDYGAALWDVSAEDFEDNLHSVSRIQFENSGFIERVAEFLGDDQINPEDIVHQAIAHKEAGSITFVVLMDQMDQRLKTLIRYVNANSKFDVIGVSLDFYEHDSAEIIIPDIFGAEVRKEVEAKARVRKTHNWNEESFFEHATQNLSEENLAVAREIYAWSKRKADDVSWGTGEKAGSFGPVFIKLFTRRLFTVYTDGNIWMPIRDEKAPPNTRETLLKIAQSLVEWGVVNQDFKKEAYMEFGVLRPHLGDFLSLIEASFEI